MTQPITHELLTSILAYDPETGILRWKKSPLRSKRWNTTWAGKAIGCPHAGGYLTMGLMLKSYAVHRVIWFLVTGAWPIAEIDHVDGDKHNNRLSNLREASRSQNEWNKGIAKNNKSGYKGVCFNNRARLWQASIRKGGRRRYLGLFSTAEEAAEAYRKASTEMHGEFARHT